MSRSAAEQVEAARKRGVCVFGETLAAAIGTDGTNYSHKCWKHAAGHVLSPPLRPDTDTPRVLMNMLAKWVETQLKPWIQNDFDIGSRLEHMNLRIYLSTEIVHFIST